MKHLAALKWKILSACNSIRWRCVHAIEAIPPLWRAWRTLPRWAWLRATGKTAYRFAPFRRTHSDLNGDAIQANGWVVPNPHKPFHDATRIDDLRAAWDKVYGK